MYTVGMGIGIPDSEITEGRLTGFYRTKYRFVLVHNFEQAKARMAILLTQAPDILKDHYSDSDLMRLAMATISLQTVREEDSEDGLFIYSPDRRGSIFIIQHGEFIPPEDSKDAIDIEIMADHTQCDHKECKVTV